MELTVLIPVFNTEPFALMEAAHSIINQNYEHPFKIILIDDASTDPGTKRALKNLELIKNPKRPIEVIRMEKNGGTSAALNAGHFAVDTEYVAIMGSDDISDPKRIGLQMDHLKANKKIDVCGTDLFSFKANDIFRKPIYTSNHPQHPTLSNTLNNWLVNHGTVMYKQSAVMDVGGYDPKVRRGQDVELWGRMARAGKVFYNIKVVMYAWRKYQS